MTKRLALAAGAAAFLIVATANSGGYRYGISDQAFYVPAVARATDATRFPRDSVMLAPQMRWWVGDEILAFVVKVLPLDLPQLFAFLYAVGVLLLFYAGAFLARGLGASWWATGGAIALLTLRHRIAKTGANSLEGYMHPRMIAFGLGMLALGFVVRRRFVMAVLLVALAGVAHPTTALWFGAAMSAAVVANLNRGFLKRAGQLLMAGSVAAAAAYAVVSSARIDREWLAVLAAKDYLFSHQWPAYAWVVNLSYPVVLILIYRRRRTLGLTRAGEWPMIAGLLALAVGFLISVPLAAIHVAPIVQLQVNRIFWLLDGAAMIYLAWWLVDDVAASRRAQLAAAAVLAVLACGRGVYILANTGRPLVRIALPADDWTGVMNWLRDQAKDWHVLADPGHAWRYGTSVRVAALRDTTLELGKDSAMALYDRSLAIRVAEREQALASFETFSAADLQAIGRRFDAHVVVVPVDRSLDLPRIYANGRFAAYSLR